MFLDSNNSLLGGAGGDQKQHRESRGVPTKKKSTQTNGSRASAFHWDTDDYCPSNIRQNKDFKFDPILLVRPYLLTPHAYETKVVKAKY
jgi:hypothetical protein